jgi:MFS family permease
VSLSNEGEGPGIKGESPSPGIGTEAGGDGPSVLPAQSWSARGTQRSGSVTQRARSPNSPRQGGRWRALQRLAIDVSSLRDSRDWRLLFIGQAVMVIGEQIRIVAVPYLVFVITHSSFVVGLASLAQFVPTLFLSLAGGTLADRVDRRKLLIVAQGLLMATVTLLAVATMRGLPSVWLIFLLVGVAAGIQAVEGPARRAVMPRLVGSGQVANALALDQVTFNFGDVLGPALGGLMIAKLGAGSALLVNAGALVFAFVTLLFVSPMPPEPSEGPLKSGWAAVQEGFAFLRGKPAILSTFLIDLNAMFFGSPAALMPAFATQIFRVGPFGLGLLYAAPGAGALLGALVTGWVSRVRRQGRAVIICVCIWGVAIAAFGLVTRWFWLALLLLAISGAADMFSAVFRSTILLRGVPDRLRGRLSAVHFLVVTSGPRFGDVEAGAVAALAGTQFSVISGGIGSVLGALILAFAIPAFARYDARTSPEVLNTAPHSPFPRGEGGEGDRSFP